MNNFWYICNVASVRVQTYFKIKFARSIFGQFWNTLSTSILIVIIASVWSMVWDVKLADFMPYYTISYLIFLYFISTCVESTNMINADAVLYRYKNFPFILSAACVVMRNAIIFVWNIPIYLLVLLYFNAMVSMYSILYLACIIIIMVIFLLPVSLTIGIISHRYRDVAQLFLTIFSVALLFSPVLWQINQLPESVQPFVLISPISIIIHGANELLMYNQITLKYMAYLFIEFLVFCVVAYILNKRFNHYIRSSI